MDLAHLANLGARRAGPTAGARCPQPQRAASAGILTVQRLLTEPGSILYASPGFDTRPAAWPQPISNAADATQPRLDDAVYPQVEGLDTGAVLGAILHHLEVRS